jgi:hypothetical protein
MTIWTSDELATADSVDEMQISSVRGDSTLSGPRTIWVVRDGQDLYVRSVNGPGAAWFRGTQIRREGHIRIGGLEKDVTFVDADPSINDQLDVAYRDKYRSYAKNIVDSINSPEARSATIKLLPR